MPPMGGQCLQPALGFLLVAFFLSLFAVGHSLNHLLPSAWREEAALGVMLRWDSVRGGLTEEGCGARPGSTLLWGTSKGMLGFPTLGWAMPKASGTLQLTFFPRHEERERRGDPAVCWKGSGVKAMACWDTVSPGGSSGRAARLVVAWGASYAKRDLCLSSDFFLPRSGWSQYPMSLLQRECALGKCR